jgi:hypothetical protein
MDAGYSAAISGFVGALIGSISSIITIVVQSRAKDRRDRSKQVTDLSLAEFSMRLELAKSGRGPSGVLPISTFIFHNNLLLKALDDGTLTPEKIAEIAKLCDSAIEAVDVIEGHRKTLRAQTQ